MKVLSLADREAMVFYKNKTAFSISLTLQDSPALDSPKLVKHFSKKFFRMYILHPFFLIHGREKNQ